MKRFMHKPNAVESDGVAQCDMMSHGLGRRDMMSHGLVWHDKMPHSCEAFSASAA